MAGILKSQAAFRERCADCGLTTTEIDGLIAKGVTSMSVLAYTLTTPGVTPDEASLRGLMNSASPGDVTVQTLASIRRLVFESQTLAISQIKSIIEADAEKKIELAPAERATRIKDQKARLAGYELSGPLENAFSNYSYVAAMVESDHVVYLEPHRFITRQSEVTKERPGKELILDEASRISVRDKQHREKCTIQNELQLAEAWTRRALACDLMQVTTFSSMEKWHRFLLSRLSLSPPPHFQPTNIEQLLRCDRAAWMRLSELVPSLKRDDAGRLPLDEAFEKMESDPQVLFHLLPMPGKRALSSEGGELHKGRGRGRGKGTSKGRGDGKGAGQGAKRDAAGGFKRPTELSDDSLHHNTSDGSRICWNFNLKKGCSFAKAGEQCKRGYHVCMKCLQPHGLLACPAWKMHE